MCEGKDYSGAAYYIEHDIIALSYHFRNYFKLMSTRIVSHSFDLVFNYSTFPSVIMYSANYLVSIWVSTYS